MVDGTRAAPEWFGSAGNWEIPVQNQEACRIQYMDYLEWRVQMCDSLPITQGVIDAQ
jgi:hypothetical protein